MHAASPLPLINEYDGAAMKKAFFLGVAASFFFAFTFVLNRKMDLAGGHWSWSASLRFFFMLPMLFALVLPRGGIAPVFREAARAPGRWILWSTVGFGIFYAPLCFAAAYGESWLVAATWQITIVAGALTSPLFFTRKLVDGKTVTVRNRISKRAVGMSLVILAGVFLLQFRLTNALMIMAPIIIAAFAYPLGNRKMMELCGDRLSTFQRVFGMTLCGMPFWILLSAYGFAVAGLPSPDQITQSLLVALSSGVIATLLFFRATGLVRGNVHQLAAIEATQAGEVLFAVLGEIYILHDRLPSILDWTGLVLVVAGMTLSCFASTK